MNADPNLYTPAWGRLWARLPAAAWQETFLRDWAEGRPVFAETDPERGLWYLEWSTGQGPTLSVSQVQLAGPAGRLFLRLEWDARGRLAGLEGQSPVLPPWVALAAPFGGREALAASDAAWADFCAGLHPGS